MGRMRGVRSRISFLLVQHDMGYPSFWSPPPQFEGPLWPQFKGPLWPQYKGPLWHTAGGGLCQFASYLKHHPRHYQGGRSMSRSRRQLGWSELYAVEFVFNCIENQCMPRITQVSLLLTPTT